MLVEFSILIAICGASAISSVMRLLRQRFLHPADLATVSTLYYSVPLAVAGYLSYNPRGMIFLHGYAADPGIAIESLRFVALAVVSLQVGRWLGSRLPDPQTRFFFTVDRDSWIRATVGYAALLGMIFFGIGLFGLGPFMAGYATESFAASASLGTALVYFATGSLGLIFAYTIIVSRVKNYNALYVLMFVSILVLLFVLIVRSKRLEIVSAILPAAILLLSNRSAWSLSWGRLALAGAGLAGLVAISFYRIEDDLSLFTVVFYALSEGLYAGHSLPGILANLDMNTLGFENGSRFVNSLLGFVPRFLWEGKDDMVYAGNVILESVAPLGATNLLAEVVLQGGIIAVGTCYAIMGFVFERLTKFERDWDSGFTLGQLPLRFCGYIVAIAVFVPHFRDGIIPAFKLSLQGLVFLLALVGIRIIARRAKEYVETPRMRPDRYGVVSRNANRVIR